MTHSKRLQQIITKAFRKRADLADRYRTLLYVATGAVFVSGTVLSWNALPNHLGTFEWWPLVVMAVACVPATIFLNAAEYRQIARIAHLEVTQLEALRIAVLATAANLAPVPGALLVKWGDMSRRGTPWGKALSTNIVAGAVWLTLSAIALMFVAWSDRGIIFWTGAGFALLGALIVGVLARPASVSREDTLRLGIIESGLIGVSAVRALLVLSAFGLPGGLSVSIAIASTYSLANLLGIFPGGLGIRELLSGLVSQPATGGMSTGFLVAAIDRLIGLAVHIPLAIWLSVSAKRTGEAPTAEASN